ncbi:ATP-dependent RNA helicase TDRD9-like [Ornithodoros turicata]|uniref:ATP-dependent RNA helicase TDRD9-like n=1 Tax=Ornithodoros turicata TaxID=34597 RepID=UPI003138CBD2
MAKTAADITLDDILSVFSSTKQVKTVQPSYEPVFALRATEEEIKALEQPKRAFSQGTDYAKRYQLEELKSVNKECSSTLSKLNLPGPSRQASDVDAITAVTMGLETTRLDDLQSEDTERIYATYFGTTHQHNGELPIAACKDQIVKMVDTYPVVVIQGTTGCGKTTQVPQYLLDSSASRGKRCNIVVTQPRRIAAISVAKRVCQERQWNLGTVVGYQVGLDNMTSADTRLAYVTTGVLLEKLIGQKEMNAYTHVIIDEVHERDQETDFLLLVVRKFLRSNSRGVKVILMSATIDVAFFTEYFSTSFLNKLEPAPVIEIPGKMKSVKEYYIGSLHTLGEIPQFDASEPYVPQESFVLAHRLIKVFDRIERGEQEIEDGRFAPVRGTVLVFLPGYEEISTLTNILRDDCVSLRWSVLPLHSTVTQQEQQSVFLPPTKGHRKIILSTNIAESSITVPDIKYVIDFCLTKSLICDPDTNYSCLKLEWASKANCKQRQGRAGRVSEGRLYRMVPEDFYENVLPDYGIPEMKRCPLELTVLKAKKLDLGEPRAILALCLDPPDLGDIERAILALKEVSALTTIMDGEFNPYDGDLTFLGKVMANLPLDVRVSKMIILGFVFNCLEDCVIIAACLSVQSMFSKPFQKLLEAYKSRLAWADGSFSDCLAMLHAYKTWKSIKHDSHFDRRGGLNEKAWCSHNFLQLRRLREIERLIDEITKRLQNFNIRTARQPNRRRTDSDEHFQFLRLVICGAFYPHYFVHDTVADYDNFRKLATDPLCTVLLGGVPQNQGPLYDHALRRMFSCCSEQMKIHFEETRATIEFIPTNRHKVGVLPAVYNAVKMRQLRLPLELHLFKPDEAKEKMERLLKLSAEQNGTVGRLRSNRMVVVPNINPIKSVPLPGTNQMTVNIYCTSVVTCGHFYAHYSEQSHELAEQHMNAAINHNNGKHLKPIVGPVKSNMLVLAPFKGAYYRARIEEVFPQDGSAQVFFVDYGDMARVKTMLLREIDPETLLDALITPAQAFECKLAEVKPSVLRSAQEQWTGQANETFLKMVMDRHLIARVYSVVDNVVHVHLFVKEPDGRTLNVNEELVRLGLADDAEESLHSVRDHQLRERVESYYQSVSDMRESGGQGCGEVDASKLNFGVPEASSRRARLHGPFSPLECKLCGVTRLCDSRGVHVERTSVNSVVLNPEPQNPHPRMVVASHVSQSATSDNVTLRNTTLMPSIPGLHCLMPILFSPYVEFRANRERTEYTGALCGLGYDRRSNLPVYPEHDIEVVFDISMEQDDMFMINVVRMFINMILQTDPGRSVIDWDGPGLLDKQDKARKYLMSLLNRKRQPREPQPCPRRYYWGLLDDECRLKPPKDNGLGTVLEPHDCVLLETSTSTMLAMKNKLEELHMMASNCRSAAENMMLCPVCNVMSVNPYDLLHHLKTKSHMEKEAEVFDYCAVLENEDDC